MFIAKYSMLSKYINAFQVSDNLSGHCFKSLSLFFDDNPCIDLMLTPQV